MGWSDKLWVEVWSSIDTRVCKRHFNFFLNDWDWITWHNVMKWWERLALLLVRSEIVFTNLLELILMLSLEELCNSCSWLMVDLDINSSHLLPLDVARVLLGSG